MSLAYFSPEQIEASITKNTTLITLMLANNETGVLQPIKDIVSLAKKHKVRLLTDAVQCIGKIPVTFPDYDVDFMSISGHKIYAPKGIGLLYVKNDEMIDSLVHGGGHERQLRAGTENVAGIAALAKAFEWVEQDSESESQRLLDLKYKLI